ncbi:MAG: hypothetical protein C4541_10695 [Candidatus Auribacter fodinae]|jgi:hypothetical protein|uniref:Uncharacterized protein n=1 Tax=Candidatus Auribacter fodinae TaxID=2093366 RepID=A0A3A4QT30_9BACT|nr:MAG: hypothetical protein C4541_10695 [Candidatus Auribacter fodinae]
MLFIDCTVQASVTTSNGYYTIDFYEDTLSGIENRWIFDLNVNDPDVPGDVEELFFDVMFFNPAINFSNSYNPDSPYYEFSIYAQSTSQLFPVISSDQLATPVGTTYLFYATPLLTEILDDELQPVMGSFGIRLENETFMFNGPVNFVAVPEPACGLFFIFGAWFLRRFSRVKRMR